MRIIKQFRYVGCSWFHSHSIKCNWWWRDEANHNSMWINKRFCPRNPRRRFSNRMTHGYFHREHSNRCMEMSQTDSCAYRLLPQYWYFSNLYWLFVGSWIVLFLWSNEWHVSQSHKHYRSACFDPCFDTCVVWYVSGGRCGSKARSALW